MTAKPCDRAFDDAEKKFRKAAKSLLGAAIVCVHLAGHDLARACRVFRDPEIAQLGDLLTENLRGEGNFENVLDACHRFSSPRRRTLNHQDPASEDLVVISTMYLEDACQCLLADGFTDLPSVGPCTVRSRIESEKILQVLQAR